MRHVLSAIWIAVIITAMPREVAACSCMDPGPPCAAFWNTDAVFDATVVSITRVPRQEGNPGSDPFDDDIVVTLEVHRGYKGVPAGPLEVTTHSQGSACGYPFKPGQRYLVFARVAAQGLSVSSCSGTRAFNGTGPAAEFLASLEAPPRGGRVYGTVQTTLGPIGGPPLQSPLVTDVKLTGPGGTKVARSSGGRYDFSGLTNGSYELDVQPPDGYSRRIVNRVVQIANEHGCAEANYVFGPDGRIAGRALAADGKPLGLVRIELIDADAKPDPQYGVWPRSETTDPDGAFEFKGLPPGRFVVGLNLRDVPTESYPYARAVYPDGQQPQTIELTLGQAVDLGTWRVIPPLPAVQVRIAVVREDGTPVRGIYVHAWDETGDPAGRARGVTGDTSDAAGQLTLKLLKNRIYRFTARDDARDQSLPVTTPRLDTSQPVEGVRLVIR